MPDNNNNTMVDFCTPEKENNTIIKVIGVGGGGGNAVNHMYREGIHDVSFVLCNTDNQALNDSPVPVLLQLGTEGLGAGNKPAKARQAAEESLDAIKNMLSDGTKMTFITAGMGGGTGTGAAPVIARVSKELGILTVGIVTIPFRFEGKRKIDQALDGVEEMAKHVDALLVINNERLRKIYPDLTVLDAFGKADDTLSVAAKSIAEIITNHGLINLDFNDVKTVLKDGGVAIMSTGYGEGEGRVKQAIADALNSPLLNDNDVFNAKKILFGIENVDGMNSHIKKIQQEEDDKQVEIRIKNDNRRIHYYGNDKGGTVTKRRPHIFRFSADDLDNEEVILTVDTTPTYKRTLQQLNELRRRIVDEKETVKPREEDDRVSGLISFDDN